jgi:hypothetical protein
VLVLATACAGAGRERAARLHVVVVRPPHDTLRFAAPAEAHRCAHGGGIVVEGLAGGNGALLRARGGDSLDTGDYPLLTRGDTISARGALVGVRWTTGSDARGVTLDSGIVTVRRTRGLIDARVNASGLEVTAAQRVKVEATFDGVPLSGDTVTCRVQL